MKGLLQPGIRFRKKEKKEKEKKRLDRKHRKMYKFSTNIRYVEYKKSSRLVVKYCYSL